MITSPSSNLGKREATEPSEVVRSSRLLKDSRNINFPETLKSKASASMLIMEEAMPIFNLGTD